MMPYSFLISIFNDRIYCKTFHSTNPEIQCSPWNTNRVRNLREKYRSSHLCGIGCRYWDELFPITALTRYLIRIHSHEWRCKQKMVKFALKKNIWWYSPWNNHPGKGKCIFHGEFHHLVLITLPTIFPLLISLPVPLTANWLKNSFI
jgi:hypothetical protein